MWDFRWLFCLLYLLSPCSAATIWAFMPLGSQSHKNVIGALVYELGARGHNVTFFNPFPPKRPSPGVDEVVFKQGQPLVEKAAGQMWRQLGDPSAVGRLIMGLINASRESCLEFFEWNDFQSYYQGSKGIPDLILISIFFQDCLLIIPHKFRAPFMYVSPVSLFPTVGDAIGVPSNPSFIPAPGALFSDQMSFKQRIINFVHSNAINIFLAWLYFPWVNEFITNHNDGEQLTAYEIQKNVSLILLNADNVMEAPRPFTPDVVKVGAMHCRPAKPIPKELEAWIQRGKKGFIYFSLGSAVRGSDMPERFRSMIVEAFEQLPEYQILWKWETETMVDLPRNVKLSKWLPQQDLLARDDCRLFITHGGLLSTQEAMYHGVPVVGIAVAADQMHNMQKAEQAGAGIALQWGGLTPERLLSAVRNVLDDPSYREHLARQSAIMKDQPQTPLERAVFWTEYVIRHKGAPHLRSAARDLTWYQYHLIDVWAFLLGVLGVFLFILLLLIRTCIRCMSGSSARKPKSKKE